MPYSTVTTPPWRYQLTTPAGGLEYHNPVTDQVAVVYRCVVKLYSGRVPGTTKAWPCYYNRCDVFEREEPR